MPRSSFFCVPVAAVMCAWPFIPAVAQPAPGTATAARFFDVRAFGAKGDGKTLDTEAINKAIEAATDGGIVEFSPGTYLSFSIHLKSHITLQLDQGCVIVAAQEAPGFGAYDAAEPNESGDKLHYQDFGHSHFHNSLIWGENLEDIAIVGSGRIYGKGLPRANGGFGRGPGGESANPNGTPGPKGGPGGDFAGMPPLPPAPPLPASSGRTDRGKGGNKSIALVNCRNVLLRDFSILQGGWFALLATGVDNLTIDNLKVDTNRDGFDIDGCRNVRISDCSVNAINDDAIVLKTSLALGALRDCENITITGCQVSGYDTGSFLDGTYTRVQERAADRDGPTGRIKIGTETDGGFRNIVVSNCVFDRSRGLALETVDGGTIEGIAISNITMRNICNAAIFIRIGNRARAPEGTPVGAIRDVTISHVVATDVDARYPILIAGLPGHPVEDVRLSDIRVASRGGLTLEDAARQPAALINRFFLRGPGLADPRDPYQPPEQEKGYPEPSMFGILPAYGIYMRHARNVAFRDVSVDCAKADTRPVVVLDEVNGADFDGIQGRRSPGVPFFVLRRVTDVSLRHSADVSDQRVSTVEQKSL